MRQGPEQQGSPDRPRVFYGWWMVLLAGLVGAVTIGPFDDARGIFAFPLAEHFGWSRAELAIGPAIGALLGLAAPAVGYLTDRYGPRRMVLVGLILTAVGSILFGRIQSLWWYYAAFFLIGSGQTLGGFIPLVVLLCYWFSRRRNTAIAVFLVIPSVVGMILIPLISAGMTLYGWRLTSLAVSVVIILATVLVWSRMRNRPEDMGQHPDGDPAPPGFPQVSLLMGQILRSRSLWFILSAEFLVSAGSVSVAFFLALMLSDRGHAGTTTIGLTILASTLATTIFYLVGGLIGNRIEKRIALACFAVLQAMGMLVLALDVPLAGYFLGAVIAGMGTGGITTLALTILPDYFGTAHLGKILGMRILFASLVGLLAAPLVGLLLEVTGSYFITLLTWSVLALLGAFLFLNARAPAPGDPQPTGVT